VNFGALRKFPTGLRHVLYFLKLCFVAQGADYIIALDIFSVAFPASLFAKLFNKKVVVRVGGDFLWESFVERTHAPILLSQFYSIKREFTFKEKMIFKIIRFVLHSADTVVFSTQWQRNIMQKPYDLDLKKTCIIENFYPSVSLSTQFPENDFSQKKIFLSPSRDIFLKNKKALQAVFEDVANKHPEIILDETIVSHEKMLEKIKQSYAVIVPSLSEVSPNLVLHALAYATPIIVTEDMGLADRLKDLVVFVNSLSKESIREGIEKMLNPDIYNAYKQKMIQRTFTHSWSEIAKDFLDIYKNLK
jgi:hypothetical protein